MFKTTADDVLAESLARLEYKVDILLKTLGFDANTPFMGSSGESCPVCKQYINYQIDFIKGVVVRKCNCSSGKIVLTLNLTQQGNSDASNTNKGT